MGINKCLYSPRDRYIIYDTNAKKIFKNIKSIALTLKPKSK